MVGEQRKRGVSPSSEGLKLVERAMNDRCWNAEDVTDAVSSDVLLDKRTVDRFLGKDAKNPRVDKKTAQLICKVLDLQYEQVIDEPVKLGQLETDKPTNPFTSGLPVSADRFHGRKRTIADLKNRIGARSAQCVNLVGLRRSGKTSMLQYVQARSELFFAPGQNPLIVLLDLQDGRYHSPIGMIEGLRVGIAAGLGEEPWKRSEERRVGKEC